MKNEPTTPPAQAIALERYALIAQIQDRLHQEIPLAAALEQVACCPVTRPDGTQRLYARRTIEDWYYAHQQGGFAALIPKTRSDKGQPRILTPEQSRWVLEQAQAHLAVPVKVLYRRWRQQDPQLPSLPSIYRLLREHELHAKARRQQRRQPLAGPTKCFEAPAVNDLWMVDFSPGPFLTVPGRPKALPTHLCALIDDHSRLIPHAQFYLSENTDSFRDCLLQALQTRGLPRKLYVDNGAVFKTHRLKYACARLGIVLVHRESDKTTSGSKVDFE